MINENTLNILQNIGFGADIDSLESYLIDFEDANKVADLERYKYNCKILKNILKELKPDSVVFSDREQEEIKEDKYACLFEQYGNIRKPLAYGTTDTIATADVRDKINNAQDSVSDILALVEIQGLDCMCTYKDGYLCKAYLIGESKRYKDITYYLDDIIPKRIKQFSEYGLVELRGKLTTSDKDILNLSLHTETALMHTLRCELYMDKINIVFNDILSDELNFKNQWEKMEFMQQLDIEVTPYVLVRGIDVVVLPQAIVDISNAINNLEIKYDTYGIEIRLNEYMDNNTGFRVVLKDADYKKTYESVVKAIATDDVSGLQIIKILDTKCNKEFTIDEIYVPDIFLLEKLGIAIGNKIKFKVIEGKAILV